MKTNSSKAVISFIDFELRLQRNKIRSSKSFASAIFNVFVKNEYCFLFNDLVSLYGMQSRKTFRNDASFSSRMLYRNYSISFTCNNQSLSLLLGLGDIAVEFNIVSSFSRPVDLFKDIKERFESPTKSLGLEVKYSSKLYISSVKFLNPPKNE